VTGAINVTFGGAARDSQWREVEPLGPYPDGESGMDDAVGDQYSRRWEQPHPSGDGTLIRTTISATAMDNGTRRWIHIDTEWQHLDARGEELQSWDAWAESICDGPSGEPWPTPADVCAEIAQSAPADWDSTPLLDTVSPKCDFAAPEARPSWLRRLLGPDS
jgi:hypothetical protein